ncbi:hypothetical protein AJ80_10081, partial [Polytolypa hystricis UAMH7299]
PTSPASEAAEQEFIESCISKYLEGNPRSCRKALLTGYTHLAKCQNITEEDYVQLWSREKSCDVFPNKSSCKNARLEESKTVVQKLGQRLVHLERILSIITHHQIDEAANSLPNDRLKSGVSRRDTAIQDYASSTNRTTKQVSNELAYGRNDIVLLKEGGPRDAIALDNNHSVIWRRKFNASDIRFVVSLRNSRPPYAPEHFHNYLSAVAIINVLQILGSTLDRLARCTGLVMTELFKYVDKDSLAKSTIMMRLEDGHTSLAPNPSALPATPHAADKPLGQKKRKQREPVPFSQYKRKRRPNTARTDSTGTSSISPNDPLPLEANTANMCALDITDPSIPQPGSSAAESTFGLNILANAAEGLGESSGLHTPDPSTDVGLYPYNVHRDRTQLSGNMINSAPSSHCTLEAGQSTSIPMNGNQSLALQPQYDILDGGQRSFPRGVRDAPLQPYSVSDGWANKVSAAAPHSTDSYQRSFETDTQPQPPY